MRRRRRHRWGEEEVSYWIQTPHGRVLSTEPFHNGNVIYATAMHAYLTQTEPLSLLAYEPEEGVLSRYHDSRENTAVDDYVARCCDPNFARRFLRQGRTGLGFFDLRNTKWYGGLCWAIKDLLNPKSGFTFLDRLKLKTFRHFLFRHQGMWQHARIRAGEVPGPLGVFAWCKAIEIASKKAVTNQDSWAQSHLMVLGATDKFSLREMPDAMRAAIMIWRLGKPAPTWEIMAGYIGTEDHPLVRAWKAHA